MSEQFVELFENDTQPQVTITYEGVDVSAFEVLRLHIFYPRFPLVIDGVVNSGDHTTFAFPVQQKVTGKLSADALVGDSTISVEITGDGQDFSSLPTAGEVCAGGQFFLYSGKSGSGASGTLTLVAPLACAIITGSAFEKLPDYRRGNWDADVETVNAAGDRLTFYGLKLKIAGR